MARSSRDRLLNAIGIELVQSADASAATAAVYKDKYSKLGPIEVKHFIPDPSHFTAMGKPKRGDWLAEHKECDQTYHRYISGAMNRPTRRQTTIYLLPLIFKEDPVPVDVLKPLRDFATIFFGLPVKLLPAKNFHGKVAERMNADVYQVHAGEILTKMKDLVRADGFCTAGITMCDLYPREEWNFVFGLAQLGNGCGVYSLARYLSNFGEDTYAQVNLDRDPIATLLVRACKTMCHEIGHMFGLKHCTFYDCIMNGSNHLDESDHRPSFLCPVCLRKLQYACKFDIVNRYKDMHRFWAEFHLKEQADWLETRLHKLTS